MNTSQPEINNRTRLIRRYLRETIQTLLLILAIYVGINLTLPRYIVEGGSMQPTFNGAGYERVIVNRLEYLLRSPRRGDIVVLDNPDPNNPDDFLIKRVIGLPNDHIEMRHGRVYANGVALNEPYVKDLCALTFCDEREWNLGEDEYLVLGDNRNQSHDSTAFGPIKRSLIVGRAWIRYWPPEEWMLVPHYDYKSPEPQAHG